MATSKTSPLMAQTESKSILNSQMLQIENLSNFEANKYSMPPANQGLELASNYVPQIVEGLVHYNIDQGQAPTNMEVQDQNENVKHAAAIVSTYPDDSLSAVMI